MIEKILHFLIGLSHFSSVTTLLAEKWLSVAHVKDGLV
jgi:hypothetical protein